jgi:SAM-dependent methyltransferase
MSAEGWLADLYDDRFADLFLDRPSEVVEPEAAFLIRTLGLQPGDRVFDQGCGIGSLSLPLARAGLSVVAIDQAEAYIRRARRDAGLAGLACDFRAADSFDFVTEVPCDAAFNWWTSFGYATEDERNAAMLRRAFESLKPGGSFVLDFQNMARILRDFRQCIVRRGTTPEGEILLLRESTVDLAAGLLRQVWTFVLPDGRRVLRQSSLRTYLPDALARMLRSVGFDNPVFFGDLDGRPLEIDSPRCIALARRPSA